MTEVTSARNEPYVGKELSERTFTVGDTMLDSHFDGLNIPRTQDADGAVRVPSLMGSGPENLYFNEIAFGYQVGHLWIRQEYELLAPMQKGETYTTTGKITDIYNKRDRKVVQYYTDFHDSDGNYVGRAQHHQSFLREEPSGDFEFRDPKAKSGARKFTIPEGEQFGPLDCKITLDMCTIYWEGDKNYHSDKEASLELGFKDVVIGGRMTIPYVGHLLEERYGAAWWNSGKLDIKFTNPVWPEDTFTAHGVELGPAEDDPDKTALFLWLQKPDGTIILIANASVKTS